MDSARWLLLFPAKDDAVEMANWLAGEIRANGGEVSIARVTSIEDHSDTTELARRFNEQRDGDYAELAPELKDGIREGQKGGEERNTCAGSHGRR